MNRLASILVVAASILALQAMRQTRPDYAAITSPVSVSGRMKESIATRDFKVEITGYKVARRLKYTEGDKTVELTTSGVWVLLAPKVEALTQTLVLSSAAWRGPNGADYLASDRGSGRIPMLTSTTINPGLPAQGVLIFEIPEDQLQGGKIRLAATRALPIVNEVVVTMSPYKQEDIIDVFEFPK